MKRISLYIVFAIFLVSCGKDQAVEIPSYIYIDHIDLQTTTAQGSNSAEILDAWVYMDDNPLGVFPLPARIPIQADGQHDFKIFAGIKADGISDRRRRYIFFKPFELNNFNLTRGEIDTLNGTYQPVVTYYPSSDINIWNEDFTDPFIPFFPDPASDTTMGRTITPGEFFEDGASAVLDLAPDQTLFFCVTEENFNFPTGGSSVFLELNYKTNNALTIGVRAESPGNTLNIDNTVLNPTYDDNGNLVWKKAYIELTEIVSSYYTASAFEVYFKMTRQVTDPIAYIDNVKVIYGN
jgi:hypothetical protein